MPVYFFGTVGEYESNDIDPDTKRIIKTEKGIIWGPSMIIGHQFIIDSNLLVDLGIGTSYDINFYPEFIPTLELGLTYVISRK